MSITTFLYITGGAVLVTAALGIFHVLRQHHPAILAWRWISGHHWAGVRLTNAGWFKRADKKLVQHPVHRWHYLPRIQRAGIRTGATFGVILLGYGLITAMADTIYVLISGIILAGAIAGIYGIRRGRAWFNKRVTITPLGEALAPLLNIPVIQAQQAITLPPSYLTARDGEIGRIELPAPFRADPGQRAAVEHLITSRLPVDVDFRWRTNKTPHFLGIQAAPKPPDMVPFHGYADAMESCDPGEVVLGLDRKREIRNGSFNLDDPHWGFSCGAGRGKSTFLQVTAAQILHNDPGAEFYGIDPKMNSLDPLVGIPRTYIARDPGNIQEMWDLLTTFYNDMMEEQAAVRDDPSLEFPFRLFAIDEANTFAAMSRTYWQGIRRPSDPGTPPIWNNVIAPSLWMSRRVNRHFIIVGQRLDDRATGGIGLRDSLGFRGLAGFRANQYRMLIGDGPVPKSQKPKGRWLYDDGTDEFWCQNLYATEQEIRDWATSARAVQPRVTPQPIEGKV